MHVKAIEFVNWGPFKGEHRIELEPTSYGISGPNWAGKSRFMSAVPFGICGTNPERTEDEWITRGEPAGMVAIELSTGERVERGRRRGKSTQVVMKIGGAEIQGADAVNAELVRRMLLSEDDFFACCYFRQKQIARIITMKPAERVEIVSGWIGLERADRAIAEAGRVAGDADTALGQVGSTLEAVKAELGRLAGLLGVEQPGDGVAVLSLLKAAEDGAQAALEAVRVEAERAGPRRAAREFAEVNAAGKALRAELDAMPPVEDLEQGVAAAAEEKAVADRRHGEVDGDRRRALALAAGKFDGVCPVVGSACPARKEIESRKDEAAGRARELALGIDEIKTTAEAARIEWEAIAQVKSERETMVAQLDALRARAVKLKAEAKGETADATTKLDDEAIPAKLEAAARTLAEATAAHAHAAGVVEAIAQAEKDYATTLDAAKVAGAAAVIAERAKREVMRRSVGQIEAGANGMLATCGIDLTVRFRWEREGKGLAKNCGECGAGFLPSARVKECARCGAKRGPATTDRLDLVLSDVSGAAEDLGGVSVQTAAAAWLRRRRGSPWSAAFVDEPFGALDPVNRRALAQHLAAALMGPGGFDQSFVIAHQPDALGGAKRRIEVVPGADGSRVVVA